MAQSTTNLGKIHVFPSEALYNQFKDIIADNDLALLKDDGAYIVAALLEQNGYVKFSNGLILQWGNKKGIIDLPVPYTSFYIPVAGYGNKSSSWCPTDSTIVVSVRSLAQLYVNSREGLEFYFLTVGV